MQPVWILSVDLQTKTATFQSGLSDAARSARGAFSDIKAGAGDMGRATSGSMMEARHGVMLLGEEFGIHLPRALTTFIASIGPVGAAMEAAFPFLAIAVMATLLIQKIEAMREAGMKLTEDQTKFGTAVNNAFNQLETKLIQAQIRADELRNDHLGALKGQLELIDRSSMEELVHSFDEVAKAGDVVMKELEGHWYTFGKGSDGAKHALDSFQAQYENLLSAGKAEQASGLLHGTADQAQKILQALRDKEALDNSSAPDDDTYQKGIAAAQTLQKIHVETGISLTNQIEAQQNLVDILESQVSHEQTIAAIKKLESDNARTATGKEGAGQAAEGARQAAETQLRMGESVIAGDRATAQAQLAIHRASIQERLNSDLDFAAREYTLKTAANQAEIAALDKGGKDYANQLKAQQDKALELTQAHDTEVAELTAKAAVETNAQALRDMEQGERDKIENAQRGSAARLAALDAAIKAEDAKNLQDTAHYRELLTQRVELATQMTKEENELRAEARAEQVEHGRKMDELTLAADKQHQAALDSSHHVSEQRRLTEETATAEAEYQNRMKWFAQDEADLDKTSKEYDNKLKTIRDKEKQALQQFENDKAAIKDKAEQASNQRILASWQQFSSQLASGLTQSIMGHQTWAKMVTSMGDQVVSGMIQNAIKSALADDMTKEKDAARAARKAFNIGIDIGGPAGIILAPVFGAAAFAAVMAFAEGGVVPGVGRGDIVPSMLSPGEGIVPGGVMDGLSKMARDGGLNNGGTHYHVQVKPTYNVNTIDGDGMKATLEKHNAQLTKHFESSLRKLNR